MEFLYVLCLLIFVHLLLDYPLQGDFVAKGKNHRNPFPGVPWFTLLYSHSFLHAFAVYLITNNVICFFLEWVSHSLIDYYKSDGKLSFNTDQVLHIGMKLIYVGILFL